MDGREAMAMSGPSSSYFLHSGPGPQPGLHGSIRSVQMQNPNLAAQAAHIGGAGGPMGGPTFQLESSSSPAAGGGSANVGQGEPVKRKRGRPRKYGPDGSVGLALSPAAATAATNSGRIGSGSSGSGTGRRGRGRPPGTGRKQQLASLGEWVASSAGMGFTPHILTIAVGENIATKIMSFSQQGPRAVCILSASGAVSRVNLHQPSNSGGKPTFYEGRYEILCLSGSYLTDEAGSRNQNGGLSISLSSPDNRVIGGSVGNLLIAATPVQVIVGSFIHGGSKVKNRSKSDHESGPEQELPMGNDTDSMPTRPVPMPSQTFTGPLIGGWGARQLDMRDAHAHLNIDLTRG